MMDWLYLLTVCMTAWMVVVPVKGDLNQRNCIRETQKILRTDRTMNRANIFSLDIVTGLRIIAEEYNKIDFKAELSTELTDFALCKDKMTCLLLCEQTTKQLSIEDSDRLTTETFLLHNFLYINQRNRSSDRRNQVYGYKVGACLSENIFMGNHLCEITLKDNFKTEPYNYYQGPSYTSVNPDSLYILIENRGQLYWSDLLENDPEESYTCRTSARALGMFKARDNVLTEVKQFIDRLSMFQEFTSHGSKFQDTECRGLQGMKYHILDALHRTDKDGKSEREICDHFGKFLVGTAADRFSRETTNAFNEKRRRLSVLAGDQSGSIGDLFSYDKEDLEPLHTATNSIEGQLQRLTDSFNHENITQAETNELLGHQLMLINFNSNLQTRRLELVQRAQIIGEDIFLILSQLQSRLENLLELLADSKDSSRKCEAQPKGIFCGKGPFVLEMGNNGSLNLSGKKYAYNFRNVFMYQCLPSTEGRLFAFNRQILYQNQSYYHLFEDPNERFQTACLDGDLAGFSCDVLMKSITALPEKYHPFETDGLYFVMENDQTVYYQAMHDGNRILQNDGEAESMVKGQVYILHGENSMVKVNDKTYTVDIVRQLLANGDYKPLLHHILLGATDYGNEIRELSTQLHEYANRQQIRDYLEDPMVLYRTSRIAQIGFITIMVFLGVSLLLILYCCCRRKKWLKCCHWSKLSSICNRCDKSNLCNEKEAAASVPSLPLDQIGRPLLGSPVSSPVSSPTTSRRGNSYSAAPTTSKSTISFSPSSLRPTVRDTGVWEAPAC